MDKSTKHLYLFGAFSVDVREGLLRRGEELVPLTPKAFETLLALIENSGHMLSKEELMRRVWPDSFVEENNLSQNISLLRKALQTADDDAAKYIETVPKRGYRFAASVVEQRQEQIEEAPRDRFAKENGNGYAPPAPDGVTLRHTTRAFDPAFLNVPETKYARSGDVNIAYQVIGDAPLDLVFVMGWVSHLEYFWAEPTFARFLTRLSSFARLILIDKRGTGLSDRVPLAELPTLEQRMDDVRAVMDAVGSEHAALCGVSEGGPMCSLFAATYPEKTAALVMIGTYAKRIRDAEYKWAPTLAERQHFLEEIGRHWGGPVGLEERAPSVCQDARFREWWATYLRMGASPGAAVALTKMNAEIDVRHVLPTVRVPTLVLHRTGDRCLKVEEGRYVAEKIPGARFVELPGEDHLPFVGDQEAILAEVEEFLTGVRHTPEPDRVLATVLFLHTIKASADDPHGNHSPELLTRLRAHIRKEIEWFRGREIDLTGAGLLATFDGPARAIRCACAIREYASRLNIEVRAGLHTGECDLLETNQVGGLAVEVGARVSDVAAPGQILVSGTVKDLVSGSGIRFEDHGRHVLAGVSGEWHLSRVERDGCV